MERATTDYGLSWFTEYSTIWTRNLKLQTSLLQQVHSKEALIYHMIHCEQEPMLKIEEVRNLM